MMSVSGIPPAAISYSQREPASPTLPVGKLQAILAGFLRHTQAEPMLRGSFVEPASKSASHSNITYPGLGWSW